MRTDFPLLPPQGQTDVIRSIAFACTEDRFQYACAWRSRIRLKILNSQFEIGGISTQGYDPPQGPQIIGSARTATNRKVDCRSSEEILFVAPFQQIVRDHYLIDFATKDIRPSC
ncbi:hypothetical protein AVEN_231279-1 [Araneus ventricosus]|uniref:Uncharacterized protein n=1 Tax=Araneus ventricosus TaxID=182803 RepID=A0A4Y2CJ68_ARAVE|nr:hypothetical protein AVEN_231279-1 [Araneus ventricosus]